MITNEKALIENSIDTINKQLDRLTTFDSYFVFMHKEVDGISFQTNSKHTTYLINAYVALITNFKTFMNENKCKCFNCIEFKNIINKDSENVKTLKELAEKQKK